VVPEPINPPVPTAPPKKDVPLYPLILPSKSSVNDPNWKSTLTVNFPKITYVDRSKILLCISNSSVISRSVFNIYAIAKAKVESSQRFGLKAPQKHTFEGDIFDFECTKGSLGPSEQKFIEITFKPVIAGNYTQLFLLKSNGKGVTLTLSGEASSKQLNDNSQGGNTAPVRSQHRVRNVKPYAPPRNRSIYQKPQPPLVHSTSNLGTVAGDNSTMVFDDLLVGRCQTLDLRVMNPKKHGCVFDVFVSAPFAVPTKKLQVPADSYTTLPVAFRPVRAGTFTTTIVVKYGSEVLKVKLSGKAHNKR
jgi:hypothetical protein